MATDDSAPMTTEPEYPSVASTGVDGLDALLHGGLPREEMHLVQGTAGTGKTTIALSFLHAGVKLGEPCLYVSLSQSKPHLRRMAQSHGWSVEGITIHELQPGTVAERIAGRQNVLATPDVELNEVFQDLVEVVSRVKPKRAVVDSITIVRMLAGGPQRYHGEVVTLRQLFFEHGCTVMLLADHPAEIDQGSEPEVELHPLAGCVIHLASEPRPYGDVRRRLRIVKSRGLPSNGGYHDLKIHSGRMAVFPRLGAYELPEYREFQRVASGIEGLDRLLAGGLEKGTTCLIVGPPGVGKSTLAAAYAAAVAKDGGHAAIYLLDERPATYIDRSEVVGLGLEKHVVAGRVLVRQLDPGEIAPGELAQQVKALVEERGTQVVILDSVVGYFNAMGSSDVLVTQLHELLTYLARRGVLTILCGSQEGFMSIGSQNGVDVSYLSDSIVVLGYFEASGSIRRCLAVVKMRVSGHDTTIHELFVSKGGVRVSAEPLRQFGNLLLPISGRRARSSGEEG